ncbi:MAG: hypothetical protein IRZ16_24020 [Myxococcaceae bacterium]|nr:hypothetical protein [Myxococcaceae bacterium]
MTAFKRLALLAGLAGVSVVLTACPVLTAFPGGNPSGSDGGPDGSVSCNPMTEECTCVEDEECGDTRFFLCNRTTNLCQPACRTKADCSAEVRGEYALDYCSGNLGCECDEGSCVAALCSADSDCGANNACRNGACVPAPDAATAQTCQITPDFAIVKSGQPVQFWVSFWSADQAPVVLKSGIEWTAQGMRVTNPQANGATATFTGGSAGAAESAVQVKAGNATCTAKVVTLDATVPAGKLRVTTIDELTGRPVTGGTILLSNASDGSQVAVALMDSSGSTLLDNPGGKVTVSAFHTDYGYLTVANYDTSGSRDLLLALRRNQGDKLGGATGKLTDQPKTPNVHAGIAGMSIPGAVTDLNLTQLLGFTVPTDVKIGTQINEPDVPLPAGVYLGFSQEAPIKDEVAAMGLAGVCTAASGVSDVEAAIKDGTCGTRTEWVLAGDVPLGELPIDAVTNGLDNIDFGKVLSRILPIFKRFTSTVKRDVEFKLVPKTDVDNDDTGEVDPALIKAQLTKQDLPFEGLKLGFAFAAKVPSLPKFHDKYADGVIILGGADVPGRGVVPLGLAAGVNTQLPVDDKTDSQADLPSPGMVLVRMAPTHSGIEGAQYKLVAVAASLQSVNDASAGLALSAVFHNVKDNKLVFDPKGEDPVEIDHPFLGFPENAKYNFTSDPQPGLAPRTFKFSSPPSISGATVIRIQFTDADDHRWQVITDVASANAGVVIPPPPGTFADRSFRTGSTTGERSSLLVQALKLENAGTAVSFKDFVELNGTNMDRIGQYLVAFSVIDYGRPQISWITPAHDNDTVPPGGTVKLSVKNFKVGSTMTDDGVVKVSFANGPSACIDVTISNDPSMGKGELSATLPAGCEGAGIEMTATLYNGQGQPIAPAVSATRTVNIQP